MDRCSVATGPLDRRFTSRGRGREAVTPRAALGHRTNRSVPGLRRGKLADGRNNFGLWRSALGRHSQEETELRIGDSSEQFKQPARVGGNRSSRKTCCKKLKKEWSKLFGRDTKESESERTCRSIWSIA